MGYNHNDWLITHKREQIAKHKSGLKWHQDCIEKLENEIKEIEQKG